MKKVFQEIKNKVITDEWVVSKCKGKGAGGITLESLLDKDVENFELPDYNGVELKTKYSKKETYITLFSATPDSYLFEIKRLQKEYGYPDKQLPQFNIFNLAVYGNYKVKLNDHYFKLYVDYNNKKVVLRIYDKDFRIVDELVSWSFDILKEKLERKLKYLVIIHADRKFEHNQVLFKYKNIKFYELTSFERFLWLIENGMIKIVFRVSVYKGNYRYGEVYDHGTAFSIDEKYISRLFNSVHISDQGDKKKNLQ